MTPPVRILCLLGLLAFAGCHPRGDRSEVQERVLMQTDFEDLQDWSKSPQPNLTAEKVRSGQVAMFVDAAHPYSATYRKALGELCDHRPRRLTFSAWVWVATPDDDAMFVVAISNPGDPNHPIFSEHVFMTPTGSFGRWKLVSGSFELPAEVHADSQVVLYLWFANAQQRVYTDDWQLTELW